jgi:hypothetical protein
MSAAPRIASTSTVRACVHSQRAGEGNTLGGAFYHRDGHSGQPQLPSQPQPYRTCSDNDDIRLVLTLLLGHESFSRLVQMITLGQAAF